MIPDVREAPGPDLCAIRYRVAVGVGYTRVRPVHVELVAVGEPVAVAVPHRGVRSAASSDVAVCPGDLVGVPHAVTVGINVVGIRADRNLDHIGESVAVDVCLHREGGGVDHDPDPGDDRLGDVAIGDRYARAHDESADDDSIGYDIEHERHPVEVEFVKVQDKLGRVETHECRSDVDTARPASVVALRSVSAVPFVLFECALDADRAR